MTVPHNRHAPFGSTADKLIAMVATAKTILGETVTIGAGLEHGAFVLKPPRLTDIELNRLKDALAEFGPVNIIPQRDLKRRDTGVHNRL